jgi:leader peptidase (prepilin peptidase)/N-methyltransferase
MGCGATLRNRDLIPVFSYLVLRGRCRNCGSRISPQYPLIELLNGVLYIIIFIARGVPYGAGNSLNYHVISVLLCFTASALIVLSVIDLRTYEIPEKINLFIFVMGLIRAGLDYHNWSHYLIGFFCVSGFLYLLYVLSKGRAIGGGDIKLMAAAGLLLGWKNILLALCLGCLIGSILHLVRMKISHADRVLAMGPYLAVGIAIAMLFGDRMWNWYLSVFL